MGGETAKRLAEEIYQVGENGEVPRPDFHISSWKEVYMNRMRENGKGLFSLLGIDRQDKEGKRTFALSMYRFYNAPQMIFVCLDESLGPYSIFDCGCFTQTVCLLATSKGLGTCILEMAVHYPDVIRKHLSIPGDKKILVGIAIGHTDRDAIINKFKSSREPIENVVHWQDIG